MYASSASSRAATLRGPDKLAISPETLSYRIAQPEDLAFLLELREECGWGVEKLKKGWEDPDRVFCLFTLDTGKDAPEDVGMGCWVLQMDDDPETASRANSTVHIASLYIRHQYQSLGLGTRAISILEQVAAKEYGAKYVSLDTVAYFCEVSADGTEMLEDFNRPGKTLGWYNKRGYIEYRGPKPMFLHPTPTNPDRLLTATFLRKDMTIEP